MYRLNLSIVQCLLLIGVTQGVYIHPTRVKRGIFGTVTSTVFETIEKIHYVPSSCIYMQPNLPSCRNVRFLFPNNGFNLFQIGNDINPTAAVSTTKGPNPVAPSARIDLNQNNTMNVQGWGQYWGLYPQTVTITHIKVEPTTVLDSRIAITYAVRGCKPQNLPPNMPECPKDDPLELAEILPTSTVLGRIEATRLPEKMNFQMQDVLESTEIDKGQELVGNQRATKTL